MSDNSGHRARKRFGQNFLHDQGIIDRILRSIRASAEDHLVEIGPGQGAITQGLVDSGCRLDVIELDRDLVPRLQTQFGHSPQFRLHQGDALAFDFSSLLDERPLRIVGNLPYNISTPLIFHLLQYREHIRDMHFMLQKEVVERLAATPGNKSYGRLGIMTQYHCQVQALFDVPPEAFVPRPKVQSAVVRLIPYRELPCRANSVDTLHAVVRTAFGQRRKTLRNTLKGMLGADELDALGIDPGSRPERLSIEDFVRIANHCKQQV